MAQRGGQAEVTPRYATAAGAHAANRFFSGHAEAGPTWWSDPLRSSAGASRRKLRSLEGDGGAGGLEGLLGLVGRSLVNLLEDGLGGAVDEVLGLLEAEGGQRADLLDDLDLLVTSGLEDDVELVLLVGSGSLAAGRGAGRGNGHGGSNGDVEGVLELLHELRELDEGHFLEGLKELVGGELRHDGRPFYFLVCRE